MDMDLTTLVAVIVGFGTIGTMMLSGNRRLEERLTARMDRFEASVDGRFAQVDARFDRFEASVDARFSQVDGRFDRLEASVDGRFDKLETKLTAQIRDVSTQLRDTDNRLTSQLTALIPRPARSRTTG